MRNAVEREDITSVLIRVRVYAMWVLATRILAWPIHHMVRYMTISGNDHV